MVAAQQVDGIRRRELKEEERCEHFGRRVAAVDKVAVENHRPPRRDARDAVHTIQTAQLENSE